MNLRFSYLLLFIPGILYIFLLFHWDIKFGYSRNCTGDEPHYIILSKSLILDHEFDVKNNYEEDAKSYEVYGPIDWHASERNGEYFSAHGLGLSFLVSPAVLLYGTLGARILLVIISCFLPFTLALFTRKTINENIGNLCSASFCVSLPFLLTASQIYSDQIASVLFVLTVYLFYKNLFSSTYKNNNLILIACFVLYILCPWFHNKFLLSYFILFLAAIFIMYRKKYHKITIGFIIVSFANLAFLALYNYTINGKLFASNNNPIDTSNLIINLKIALAFLFDGRIGISFLQPIALLGILLIGSFLKYNWKVSAFTILLFASVFIPGAMVNWSFLYKFQGLLCNRYCWSIYPLLFIPISFELINSNRIRWDIAIFSLIFMVIQLTVTVGNLIDTKPNDLLWNNPTNIGLFNYLNSYLPNFFEKLISERNIYFLLLVGISSIYLTFRNTSGLQKSVKPLSYLVIISLIWILFRSINYHTLILPKLTSYNKRYHAGLYNSFVGGNETDVTSLGLITKVARPNQGNGYLMTGNYFYLPKGKYIARFKIKYSEVVKKESMAAFDIYVDYGRGIARHQIDYNDNLVNKWQEVDLPFEIEKQYQTGIETLVQVFGNAKINVEFVKILRNN